MLFLKEVKNKQDRQIYKETIDNNHSYITHKKTPTRKIDFLIYEKANNNLIGAIGLNSATLNLGVRDKILGLKQTNKKKKLLNIANNYRFALIRKDITIKNAGSRSLKALRIDGARAWQRKYGNKLLGIETFVKPPWSGAVYKADNWLSLGQTKGFKINRLPTNLIKKMYQKGEIEKFKLKYNTNRLFHSEKSESKLIFFKPLTQRIQEKFQNIIL